MSPRTVLCSSCLQGTMSKNRKMLVREAYKRLDKTGDGVVTIEDLMIAYNANAHPEVINGRMTPEVGLWQAATLWLQKIIPSCSHG